MCVRSCRGVLGILLFRARQAQTLQYLAVAAYLVLVDHKALQTHRAARVGLVRAHLWAREWKVSKARGRKASVSDSAVRLLHTKSIVVPQANYGREGTRGCHIHMSRGRGKL